MSPPPDLHPQLPARPESPARSSGAARLLTAGLAGAAVGVAEWGIALSGGEVGTLAPSGWLAGLGLLVVTDALAGLLLSPALFLVVLAWGRLADTARPTLGQAWQAWRRRSPEWSAALLLAGSLTLLGVLGLGWLLLRALPRHVHSPDFSAAASLAVSLGALVLGVVVVPLLAWPLARSLRRRAPSARAVVWALAGTALVAAGVLGWLRRETLLHLPLSWLVLPVMFLVLIGLAWRKRQGSGRPPRWVDAWLGWGALTVWIGVAALSLGERPSARRVVFKGTRVAPAALRALRGVLDFDGDGLSSAFGGGDCAPFDPAVHPGARDVAGNGLDEDCWGGDATVSTQAPGHCARKRLRRPGAARRAQSLVLISVDALRADHLGAYGYERPTSPHIDALAAEAAVFERFYSPSPATRWALPMMQLSRWPSQIRWDRRPWPHAVKTRETTLAETLRKRRYATGATWVFRSSFGLDQGFQHWDRAPSKPGARAPEVTDAALRILDEVSDGPFYLWAHYFDPHDPYRHHGQPDLPRFGDRPVDRYDEEIALADREIGRLLEALQARGLDDSTVVMLTGDHGEAFGEHGGQAHWGQLYEELVHIPLLVRGPGIRPRRIDTAASLVDLVPTALDLLGVPPRRRERWVGCSLAPALLPAAGARMPERPAFLSLTFFPGDGHRTRAVVLGSEKLIYDPVASSIELYDLARDPDERDDLSALRVGRVHHLMGLLLPWMARHSPEGFGGENG